MTIVAAVVIAGWAVTFAQILAGQKKTSSLASMGVVFGSLTLAVAQLLS